MQGYGKAKVIWARAAPTATETKPDSDFCHILSSTNFFGVKQMTFKFHATVTASFIGTILLVACSSTPLTTPAAAPAPVTTVAPAMPLQGPAANPPPDLSVRQIAPYLDPRNPLSKERSVYFEFDKSDIAAKYDPLVQMHGKFLNSQPAVAIKVEGNTDEQGGSEYNLALGQKRADAVAKALKLLGVKDSQIEAVSFGKEKPKALGNDDAAYVQNRRADLTYPGN